MAAELVKFAQDITVPGFFDLLNELVFQYKPQIGESIVDILGSLV